MLQIGQGSTKVLIDTICVNLCFNTNFVLDRALRHSRLTMPLWIGGLARGSSPRMPMRPALSFSNCSGEVVTSQPYASPEAFCVCGCIPPEQCNRWGSAPPLVDLES